MNWIKQIFLKKPETKQCVIHDFSGSAIRRDKISKIIYENSIDDSECIRIKFEKIENVIDQLNSLYD